MDLVVTQHKITINVNQQSYSHQHRSPDFTRELNQFVRIFCSCSCLFTPIQRLVVVVVVLYNLFEFAFVYVCARRFFSVPICRIHFKTFNESVFCIQVEYYAMLVDCFCFFFPCCFWCSSVTLCCCVSLAVRMVWSMVSV